MSASIVDAVASAGQDFRSNKITIDHLSRLTSSFDRRANYTSSMAAMMDAGDIFALRGARRSQT